MCIGHRKESLKLTFRALALCQRNVRLWAVCGFLYRKVQLRHWWGDGNEKNKNK